MHTNLSILICRNLGLICKVEVEEDKTSQGQCGRVKGQGLQLELLLLSDLVNFLVQCLCTFQGIFKMTYKCI